MTAWPLQRDCAKFYGNPATAKGNASPKWERENLVSIPCPWVLRYGGKPVSSIRIHKKAAESLKRVLARIWERVGKSQAEIDRIGMSVYGGSYNFRPVRGGASLSMHAYGCAVDFDPPRNGLGNKSPAMDRRVIEEFEREGWEWGGHWSRTDGMHFQAAWTRANPPRLKPAGKATPAAKAEPLPQVIGRAEVERLQAALKDLGYHEVGLVDGIMGSKTRGALLAFKADNGLPLTADADTATWTAIAKAKPRPAPEGRASATEAPSEAAKAADAAKKVGAAVAVVGATETALQPAGGIKGVLESIGQASEAVRAIAEPLKDLGALMADNWMVVAVVVGLGLFVIGRRVFSDELESFRRGEWS